MVKHLIFHVKVWNHPIETTNKEWLFRGQMFISLIFFAYQKSVQEEFNMEINPQYSLHFGSNISPIFLCWGDHLFFGGGWLAISLRFCVSAITWQVEVPFQVG